MEYLISIPWEGASLAVSTIRSGDDQGFWPADLPYEARLQLVGAPPVTRRSDTELWPIVVAGDS